MTAQEFDVLSPLPEEIEWARERCRAEEHLFGLVLGLKCFQRLGYIPRDEQLPVEVIERVRGQGNVGTENRPKPGLSPIPLS